MSALTELDRVCPHMAFDTAIDQHHALTVDLPFNAETSTDDKNLLLIFTSGRWGRICEGHGFTLGVDSTQDLSLRLLPGFLSALASAAAG